MIPFPKAGQLWRHHSGRLYCIYFIANETVAETEAFPHMVVYSSVDNGSRWARPVREFLQKFRREEDLG